MRVRVLHGIAFVVPFFCLSLGASSQDLMTIGQDEDSLTKQSAELDDILKKLQDCVDQTTFASKKDLCRQGKDLREKQRAIITENLGFLELQSDPALLTAQLKREVLRK